MLNEYQQSDLEFIKNPQEWPGMVLPLINRNAKPGDPGRCGFLIPHQGPKLFMKYMFDLDEGIPLRSQIEGVPTTEYESFEAMLEAGWEVD